MRYCLTFLLLLGVMLPAAAQDPEYVGNDVLCAGCHTGAFPGAPVMDFDAYSGAVQLATMSDYFLKHIGGLSWPRWPSSIHFYCHRFTH